MPLHSGGVTSLAKSGDPALTGAVTLSEGANVTLTQVGQNIEIAAADGGASELAYVEAAASLITISAGSAASPTDVVSAGSVAFDGSTRVCIEVYTAKLEAANNSGANVHLNLWEDSTDLGELAVVSRQGGAAPCLVRRYLTPSNASHTFKVTGYRDVANGFVNAQSPYLPTYIRITTA